MKKTVLSVGLLLTMAAASAGCTQYEQRTTGYGMSGAALGALAGGAITGTQQGLLAGAAIGGAGGAILGNSIVSQDKNHHGYVVYDSDVYDYHRPSDRDKGKVYHNNHKQRYCLYKDAYGEVYRAPCNN